MSKRQATLPPTSHPPLGTLIDNNSLQLIEVLGVGGYGVVYRAIETFPNSHRSFAVKCLINAHGHSLRRQIHIREISLHQLASAHPSIVSLYRVVEELDHIFIIMEFATNDDLFTQILHKCRYLGDNGLIKHVFLQLIDGMQYCHSLGIYHRDLKPENVLCFDGGFRVAITDFGLATTDKTSKEFRTGSIYHMSPGIILLNLITGRNPWKSATADDPTYQAYRQNPHQFLTSVLPISQEINHLLIQILNVDWRQRLSLSELRANIQKINNFYSDTVVFEGSLARCPWEAGLDLGTGVKEEKPVEKRPVPEIPGDVEPYRVVSMSAVVSNFQSQPSMVDSLFERETWDGQHSEYDYDQYAMDAYEDDHYHAPYKSSGRSSYSSDPSEPTTPSSAGRSMFGSFQDSFDLESVYDVFDAKHYDNESAMAASYAGTSATTDTEDTQYASSSVFLATPIAESKPFPHRYDAAYVGYRTPEGYSPNASIYDPSFSSTNDPTMEEFPPISPNYTPWSEKSSTRKGSRPIKISGSRPWETKNKSHNLFNPMRFFPRSSGNSWLNPKVDAQSYSRAQPPNIRMHQPVQQPRETPGMTWTDHHYLPTRPSVTKPGTGNRYPPTKTSGYGSRPHRARDWGPGQFYDANET